MHSDTVSIYRYYLDGEDREISVRVGSTGLDPADMAVLRVLDARETVSKKLVSLKAEEKDKALAIYRRRVLECEAGPS